MSGSRNFTGSANDFLDWWNGTEFEKVSVAVVCCPAHPRDYPYCSACVCGCVVLCRSRETFLGFLSQLVFSFLASTRGKTSPSLLLSRCLYEADEDHRQEHSSKGGGADPELLTGRRE